MNVDIIPEFDKFTNNPYPRISNLINSSRVTKDESESVIIAKSSHPFTKFFNPLERSYIKPNSDEVRDGIRTNCTIRTFNEIENSINPFNKCGVKDTFDITIPGSANRSKFDMQRSYESETMKSMIQPQSSTQSKENYYKHSRLEDSNSQNVHPNVVESNYQKMVGNSLNNKIVKKAIRKKNAKIEVPLINSAKTSSIKF